MAVSCVRAILLPVEWPLHALEVARVVANQKGAGGG